MINEDVRKTIEKKISIMQEYMGDLQSYVVLSDESIVNNKDKLYSMERVFQLLVDEAVDINALLAYNLGGNIPDTLRSSFFEIVPLGIIDRQFAEKISESAKIRNQMTHDYDKLTKQEVINAIKKFYDIYGIYVKIVVNKFVEPNQ